MTPKAFDMVKRAMSGLQKYKQWEGKDEML